MRFKKVYIEITNICNLNCSFCIKDNRIKKSMSISNFENILKKIDGYTDYIYLHVKGEPLIHNNLDEILSLTCKYNKYVNITTNGVFLKDKVDILKKYNNIRQINISLHSENNKTNYVEDIMEAVDKLKNIFIVYRFWALKNNKLDNKMLEYLEKIKEKYFINDDMYNKIIKGNNIKIDNNIYINKAKEFEWPSLSNNYYNECGFCYGLKNQIGILVDGTITICCLDSFGVSNLGNIFNDNMEKIIDSQKVKNIIKGFNDRKVYLDICRHCSYKERFNKNIEEIK